MRLILSTNPNQTHKEINASLIPSDSQLDAPHSTNRSSIIKSSPSPQQQIEPHTFLIDANYSTSLHLLYIHLSPPI